MSPDTIAELDIVAAWRRDAEYGNCRRLCTEINENLLLAIREAPNLANYIDEFESLFQFNSLPSGTVVFRACPRWTVSKYSVDGASFQYPAFVSSSTKREKALQLFRGIPFEDDPVLLEMKLTEEIPAIDVNSRVQQGIDEAEFVLPRNLKLVMVRALGHDSLEIDVFLPSKSNSPNSNLPGKIAHANHPKNFASPI